MHLMCSIVIKKTKTKTKTISRDFLFFNALNVVFKNDFFICLMKANTNCLWRFNKMQSTQKLLGFFKTSGLVKKFFMFLSKGGYSFLPADVL